MVVMSFGFVRYLSRRSPFSPALFFQVSSGFSNKIVHCFLLVMGNVFFEDISPNHRCSILVGVIRYSLYGTIAVCLSSVQREADLKCTASRAEWLSISVFLRWSFLFNAVTELLRFLYLTCYYKSDLPTYVFRFWVWLEFFDTCYVEGFFCAIFSFGFVVRVFTGFCFSVSRLCFSSSFSPFCVPRMIQEGTKHVGFFRYVWSILSSLTSPSSQLCPSRES